MRNKVGERDGKDKRKAKGKQDNEEKVKTYVSGTTVGRQTLNKTTNTVSDYNQKLRTKARTRGCNGMGSGKNCGTGSWSQAP